MRIVTIILIVLLGCCININTRNNIINKDLLLQQTKSSEGLENYLQGSWNITYLEMTIRGREIHTFVEDTIIIKTYNEKDIIDYWNKIPIEYYDNYGISSYAKQYEDTLYFTIESLDSAWTVLAGDFGVFYSRISDDH